MAVPGGGMPLNMREVEELERMTNDFIRDMDTHAPVITSPPTGRHAARSALLVRTQPRPEDTRWGSDKGAVFRVSSGVLQCVHVMLC